jgi:hypothetical protein
VSVEVTGAEAIAWMVNDASGEIVLLGKGSSPRTVATATPEATADDACSSGLEYYTIDMFDSGGDGWGNVSDTLLFSGFVAFGGKGHHCCCCCGGGGGGGAKSITHAHTLA